MVLCKMIAVVSANLGGFDPEPMHVKQSVDYKYFCFRDENFPPRFKSMTARLQAKIPKFFAWQLKPGFDYYVWLDNSIVLSDPDAVKYLLDKCEGNDLAVFRHDRPDIRQEVRYVRKGIKQNIPHIIGKYENEFVSEQYSVIRSDESYNDIVLYMGGVFIYRNAPEVQLALKEWWFHNTRYALEDQISFPYVTRNLKVNVIEEKLRESKYFKIGRHNKRHR